MLLRLLALSPFAIPFRIYLARKGTELRLAPVPASFGTSNVLRLGKRTPRTAKQPYKPPKPRL